MMTQLRTQSRTGRRSRPSTPKQAAKRSSPLDAMLDPELFRALGDPTRVRLLACMIKCGRACTVSEVAECCSVDLSVVSRHLQLLHRAGVLDLERSGRSASYAVRFEHLASSLRDLAGAIESCSPDPDATGACCQGGCCG